MRCGAVRCRHSLRNEPAAAALRNEVGNNELARTAFAVPPWGRTVAGKLHGKITRMEDRKRMPKRKEKIGGNCSFLWSNKKGGNTACMNYRPEKSFRRPFSWPTVNWART